MTTPTAIEGSWTLVTTGGKIIASSEECRGAKLVIDPNFYRGQSSQTLLRGEVNGAKGRKNRQALKVSAVGGRLTAESMDLMPKSITPAFDGPVPASKAKVVVPPK